jgi:hypothetical protein
MGSLPKAQEFRVLLGLAIKLRALAETFEAMPDTELFLAAALALENRANRLAYGAPETSLYRKVDLTC